MAAFGSIEPRRRRSTRRSWSRRRRSRTRTPHHRSTVRRSMSSRRKSHRSRSRQRPLDGRECVSDSLLSQRLRSVENMVKSLQQQQEDILETQVKLMKEAARCRGIEREHWPLLYWSWPSIHELNRRLQRVESRVNVEVGDLDPVEPQQPGSFPAQPHGGVDITPFLPKSQQRDHHHRNLALHAVNSCRCSSRVG